MARIDSHQHFWRYDPAEHTWMSAEMAALKRDFLPDDLAPLLSETGLDGSIAVQARQSLEESRWLLELAGRYESIRGVVGWVDLCSDELSDQLAGFTQHSKFVGVRHVLQDEPEQEFMMRPSFRRGISLLSQFNLAYDLLLYPKHLPIAVKLVEEFPDQPFVLDHIGKPQITSALSAQERLLPWREDIQALAAFPNVYCKLSGMVTEAEWRKWQPEDFQPYLDVVFAAFGAERLMIGSDWPVCTLSADYRPAMQIVIDYVDRFSAADQAAVLGENCTRFYNL